MLLEHIHSRCLTLRLCRRHLCHLMLAHLRCHFARHLCLLTLWTDHTWLRLSLGPALLSHRSLVRDLWALWLLRSLLARLARLTGLLGLLLCLLLGLLLGLLLCLLLRCSVGLLFLWVILHGLRSLRRLVWLSTRRALLPSILLLCRLLSLLSLLSLLNLLYLLSLLSLLRCLLLLLLCVLLLHRYHLLLLLLLLG